MLEATKYTRIHGQQQLGKCLCVAGSQPTWEKFRCKIKNFRTLSLYENILQRNKSELQHMASVLCTWWCNVI